MGKRILPERLRDIRKAQGLTQHDLAEETGISQYTICKYERGEYLRESPNFRKLADFFGVTMEWLVGDEFRLEKSPKIETEIQNMRRRIPETLWKLREASGKTVKEIACVAGISEEAIRECENGKNVPRLDTAVRLAAYYGVSLDELCGRSFKNDQT